MILRVGERFSNPEQNKINIDLYSLNTTEEQIAKKYFNLYADTLEKDLKRKIRLDITVQDHDICHGGII